MLLVSSSKYFLSFFLWIMYLMIEWAVYYLWKSSFHRRTLVKLHRLIRKKGQKAYGFSTASFVSPVCGRRGLTTEYTNCPRMLGHRPKSSCKATDRKRHQPARLHLSPHTGVHVSSTMPLCPSVLLILQLPVFWLIWTKSVLVAISGIFAQGLLLWGLCPWLVPMLFESKQ